MLLAAYQKFCQNLQSCVRENSAATLKVVDSIRALLLKLLNRYRGLCLLFVDCTRLENMNGSEAADYEASCFLATVSFTTIPELSHYDHLLFERFCSILVLGLLSPEVRIRHTRSSSNISQMSISAMKCFRALLSSEPSLHSTSAHVMIAELVSSLVLAQNDSKSDFRAIRALTGTIIDLIEHRPRQEGLIRLQVNSG